MDPRSSIMLTYPKRRNDSLEEDQMLVTKQEGRVDRIRTEIMAMRYGRG